MDAIEWKLWKQGATENEIRRIEDAARKSSLFLADAPSGSSSLREAMLVRAIKGIQVQSDGITRDSSTKKPPIMTTGLEVAIAAAVQIAERS